MHKTRSNVAPCVGDVTCTNGCCRNNPCLNGGTCTEICEPTSVRYNCSCLTPFVGKRCEIQLRKSCQDYKAAGSSTSGLYTVIDDNSRTFHVVCEFDSEPGFAWNLIESFSLSNKHLFQVTFPSEIIGYKASSSSVYSEGRGENEEVPVKISQEMCARIRNIFIFIFSFIIIFFFASL